MKIFGREPAAWAALASITLQAIGAFVADFDAETQAWVNAVVLAVLGLIVAVMVHDGIIAAITGLAQAVLTLAAGLGLDWSAEKQALILSLITAVAQFAVRQVVTAPVPPQPAVARSGPRSA
ncbi:hypothetical protein [Streptomyces reticuli]|uniref:hypothetical protein n=1 Tax=Streptomyces reticuli TaxID=1926 RepID=UPI00073E0628|nr:hypothetical protein [Streptomyces sp. SID7810]CUW31798.1 hypothetical protein TUE45_06547 [Streptomyces reticuli]